MYLKDVISSKRRLNYGVEMRKNKFRLNAFSQTFLNLYLTILGTTYVSFNSLGTELLAYMNPEHLYIYNITEPTPPLKYHPKNFEPNYTFTNPLSNGFSQNPYLLCTPTSSMIHGYTFHPWFDLSVKKLKENGNKAYESKNYMQAISLYSQALNYNPYKTVLYSNRAAGFLSKFYSLQYLM